MAMEEALVARLAAAPGIAAIVGDRIDWFDRPSALPALVLTKVDAGREWTHDGPDGLDEPRVRFECWAGTKAAVAALGRALLAEMELPADRDGTRFHEGSLEFERWDRPDDVDGGIAVFRVTMDFTFFHEEI